MLTGQVRTTFLRGQIVLRRPRRHGCAARQTAHRTACWRRVRCRGPCASLLTFSTSAAARRPPASPCGSSIVGGDTEDWRLVGTSLTNADGRVSDLSPASAPPAAGQSTGSRSRRARISPDRRSPRSTQPSSSSSTLRPVSRITTCRCCSVPSVTRRIVARKSLKKKQLQRTVRRGGAAAPPNAAVRQLAVANRRIAAVYPGDSGDRQPVHTVYGGAHLFKATPRRSSARVALRALARVRARRARRSRARSASTPRVADGVYARVQRQARRASRSRTSASTSRTATATGPTPKRTATRSPRRSEVARGPGRRARCRRSSASASSRSRGAARAQPAHARSLRDHAGRGDGRQAAAELRRHAAEVTAPEQVDALAARMRGAGARAAVCRRHAQARADGRDAAVDPRRPTARRRCRAGRGRRAAASSAAHFGTYDYTAALQHHGGATSTCAIRPATSRKHMMQVALAGTGVWLSDGATNVMPVAPHRARRLARRRSAREPRVVHRAWQLHFDHMRHSLVNGFYQGWDLHPAQLPTRYAAVYAFFLEARPAATARLKNFVEKAAQATLRRRRVRRRRHGPGPAELLPARHQLRRADRRRSARNRPHPRGLPVAFVPEDP